MGVRKNAWGAVMDLGGWLRSLGLERYEAAFRENDIDDIILPRLTADDLKDLGVDSLSHRRKLLDAITALRDDASGKRPLSIRRFRRVPPATPTKTAPNAAK
jgi:hypothetical protein